MEGNGSTPALKLNVFVGFPSYGGNGGIASEHPDIREWWAQTLLEMKADPRVGEICSKTLSDTPITMVRNDFVVRARRENCHVLLMIDSDQSPLKHAGEPWFKPFWKVAFDEIYNHYQKGPLVVGAPYCGPPGSENVYVFQFDHFGYHGDETSFCLEPYTRAEAARMSGVSEVGALPTGLILFDMRIFDLLEPLGLNKEQILESFSRGEMSKVEALRALDDGWFFYEWEDQYAAQKASTEDVASTRNMAFMGVEKLGYNPLRCAWDSWIGHHKPWNVGRPAKITVEQIGANFRDAVLSDRSQRGALVDWNVRMAGQVNQSRLSKAHPPSPQQAYQSVEVHKVPPVPKDFPRDLLEQIPSEVQIAQREVCGREVVCLDHETSDAHLECLRSVIRSEHEWLGRPLKVIEVGSWMGESALAIADYCQHVLCVDSWVGPHPDAIWSAEESEVFRQVFLWNTRNEENIGHIAGPSGDCAQRESSLGVDIIIIDADHSYESTRDDIESWIYHLRDGGLMIGHDYRTRQFPGVDQAVHELFSEVRGVGGEEGRGEYWLARKEDYRGSHISSS